MIRTVAGTALILHLVAGPGFAMNAQIVNGDPKDPRVTACGVDISGEQRLLTIRPFIDMSESVPGTVDLRVESLSGSNRNATVQRTSLSNLPVVMVSGESLNIRMSMRAGAELLCELNEKIEFGPIEI